MDVRLSEEQLVTPPAQGEYLWHWFWDLRHGAPPNEAGSVPISWTELRSWSAVTSNRPVHWELLTLLSMDAVYLTETAELRRERREANKPRANP